MSQFSREARGLRPRTPLTVFMDRLPEITTSLRSGQTKRSVWQWLRGEGFQASYKTFLSYCKTSGLSRQRRALAGEAAAQFVEAFPASRRPAESGRGAVGTAKPLKQAPRFVPPFEDRD